MKLWVAGRLVCNATEGAVWELLGIYDDELRAVARCTTTNDFVAPVGLNEDAPEPMTYFPEVRYPVESSEHKETPDV